MKVDRHIKCLQRKFPCDTTVSSTDLEMHVFEFVCNLYFVFNLFNKLGNALYLDRTQPLDLIHLSKGPFNHSHTTETTISQ